MDHPAASLLHRVAKGLASREEARKVVPHLLRGCPQYGQVLAAAARPTSLPEPIPEDAYNEVFDRLLERMREPRRS